MLVIVAPVMSISPRLMVSPLVASVIDPPTNVLGLTGSRLIPFQSLLVGPPEQLTRTDEQAGVPTESFFMLVNAVSVLFSTPLTLIPPASTLTTPVVVKLPLTVKGPSSM